MDVTVGPKKRLSAKELMLLNCGAGEDSLESLGQQGDQTSLLQRKSTLNIYWSTEAEAEVPILWLSDVKSRLTGKDPDAGKDWGQEEEGVTEDEMIRWHHRLNQHEFEQTQGDGEGWGNLACCSPWDCKEADTIKWLSNNTTVVSRTASSCVRGRAQVERAFLLGSWTHDSVHIMSMTGDNPQATCWTSGLWILYIGE